MNLRYLCLVLACICLTQVDVFGKPSTSAHWEDQLDSILHYWENNQQNQGDSLAKQLLVETQNLDSLTQYIDHLRALGKYWRKQKEPYTAISWYNLGLKEQLWRAPTDSLELDAMGWLYVNLGYTYRSNLGQYSQARKNYESAVNLFDELGVSEYTIARYVWIPLANLYTRLGDYEAGERLLNRYLATASLSTKRSAVVRGLMDLGLLYDSWGKAERAEATYHQALSQPAISDATRLQILINLSASLLNQSKVEEACRYEKKIEQLIQRIPSTSLKKSSHIAAIRLKASIAQATGNYSDAEAAIRVAFDHLYELYGSTQRREIGKHHVQVGLLYFEQARYREAVISFQEALTSVVYRYCPEDLLELPTPEQCYAENTILDALEGLAKTCEAWHNEAKNQLLLETALQAREQMHLVSEELRKVYLYEGSQLQNLEDIRSRSEAGIALANRLAKLTDDPSYHYRAFLFAERDRSQLLRSAYQHEQATTSELSSEQQQAENDWQYQVQQAEENLYHLQANNSSDSLLAAAEQTLWQARNGRYEFLQRLERDNPRYYQLKYADDTPKLAALQKMLNPGQMLVEYFIGEDQLYVFTLERGVALTLHELPLPKNLEARIVAWRNSIDAYQDRHADRTALLAAYRQEGYLLYQELLAPIIVNKAINSLLIIPSGILDLLPFEALLQQSVTPDTPLNNYPYLLRQYACSYGYSASLQHTLSQLPQRGQGFGGFSPTFERAQGWNPLSCSGQTVATLPWSGQRYHFLDTAANRRNFITKAREFSVLHLATHAQANAEQGEFSFIVFSDGQGGYDSLFAQSLYHLDLANELVVLSACETALGTLYQSEGVISLARGFHYAGVRAVLTTIWQVNEDANCHILPTFYAELDTGKDKAIALHAAKLSYLQEADQRAAHPVYWAGLQLTGHNAPLPKASPYRAWWLTLLLVVIIPGFCWQFYSRRKKLAL